MPNNPYGNTTKQLLNALDNPRKLALIRYNAALFLLGLSIGLMVAHQTLWAAIAGGAALVILWRAQAKQEPKVKLSEIAETPPEM